MPTFYKILWSLTILCIVVIAIILSFGFLLVGAAVAGVFGINRYITGKRLREYSIRPYDSGEVIDLKPR